MVLTFLLKVTFILAIEFLAISSSTANDVPIVWQAWHTFYPNAYPDQNVSVGDTVTFTFCYNCHNVFKHPIGSPGACNDPNIEELEDKFSSPITYTFTEEDAGHDIWFSCQLYGHCDGGKQIIKFIVEESECPSGEQPCCSQDFKNCITWCGTTKEECMNCDNDVFWVTCPNQDCKSRWDDCTGDQDGCCPGLTCVEMNPGYSQCKYVEPDDDDNTDEPTKSPTNEPTKSPLPEPKPTCKDDTSWKSNNGKKNCFDLSKKKKWCKRKGNLGDKKVSGNKACPIACKKMNKCTVPKCSESFGGCNSKCKKKKNGFFVYEKCNKCGKCAE